MIEELLHQQLSQDMVLRELLCLYQGKSAIFYQKAPSDEDTGWNDISFPRLGYNLDFSYDPQRKHAGTLTIDVWACALNSGLDQRSPDMVIAEHLENQISSVFYTPKGQQSICTIWRDSVAFLGKTSDLNRETSPVETFGITLTFDLIAFPQQETFTPDPIKGLSHWSKSAFPQAKIIGLDPLPSVWRPTDQTPAFYWRMEGAEVSRELFACTWYVGQFYGHISCQSIPERNRWARAIIEQLHTESNLILEDESFFRIEKSLYHHDGAPLSEGQLAVWGEFGVLSQRYRDTQSEPLNHGHFTKKEIPKP